MRACRISAGIQAPRGQSVASGATVTPRLRRIRQAPCSGLTPWDARRYALAVMLHTDAGLHLAGDTYGRETNDQSQVAADLLQPGARCAPDRFRALRFEDAEAWSTLRAVLERTSSDRSA